MGKRKKNNAFSRELPEAFLERLTTIVGRSEFANIRRTFVDRPTTFRVNTLKWKAGSSELRRALADQGFQTRQVPWYADAFILLNKTKRELSETELYMNGAIYMQSLASMVPPLLLDPKPGEIVLDLTAAPGSKTSQIAALMEGVGELVANDVNKVRFFKLKHNMELLSVADEKPEWKFVLRMEHGGDLCREYREYFDKILLDAPCSAEARFVDGDIKSYGYWSERKIKEMAYKQRQLILSAWGALKPGGTLVYSTCTFAPEENEVQVARLLERNPDAALKEVRIPELKTLTPLKTWNDRPFNPAVAKAIRIYPTPEIEGFFVAVVTKHAHSM